MVVKARRRGCPWLVYRAEEPWPPSRGGSLVSFSAVFTLGVGPAVASGPLAAPLPVGLIPLALSACSSSSKD
jgi:hypothetical protein